MVADIPSNEISRHVTDSSLVTDVLDEVRSLAFGAQFAAANSPNPFVTPPGNWGRPSAQKNVPTVISHEQIVAAQEHARLEFTPLFTNETGNMNETLFSMLDRRPGGKQDNIIMEDDLNWYLSEFPKRSNLDRVNACFNDNNFEYVKHLKEIWKGGRVSLDHLITAMGYDDNSVRNGGNHVDPTELLTHTKLDDDTVQSRQHARDSVRELIAPLDSYHVEHLDRRDGKAEMVSTLFRLLDGQGRDILNSRFGVDDINWYLDEYAKHERQGDLTGFFVPEVAEYLTNLKDNWDTPAIQQLRDASGPGTRSDYIDAHRLNQIADYDF